MRITKSIVEKNLLNRFGEKELEMSLSSLPNPFLLKDMSKTVDRIISAIDNKEKITIVGDYDADGIDSVTLLKIFFDDMGYPVTWIIPNRFKHGYGISPVIVEALKSNNTTLAITVDNGISGIEAADKCMEYGIDLIITDHHLLPPNPPKAFSIINPHQKECEFPYKNICGAQVAWYLIAAIRSKLALKDIDMIYYLQLVAIATVADMMPLKHINRVMVNRGLEDINHKSRKTFPGLKFFMLENNCQKMDSQDISFGLAPRINSAGRIKDAKYAADFLMAKNDIEAAKAYRVLDTINNERKQIEQSITEKAMLQISEKDSFVVVTGKDWHEGVLGIVASKIGQKIKKPVLVLTESNEPDMLKGSGRSYCDIDLFKTVGDSRSLLDKFGGHAAAIGVSIHKDKLEEFKKELNSTAISRKYLKPEEIDPVLGIIDFTELDFDLINIIDRFGPYGQENPYPEFTSVNVFVEDIKLMGDSEQHFKATLRSEDKLFPGVCFYFDEKMIPGCYYDITFALNKNSFRNKDTLQLLLRGFTKSED